MMRKLLCIVAFMVSTVGYAQREIDNDAVLRAVIDSNSPHYYPLLESRYLLGDTTLTADDYFYLYYGFAFQEHYKPLEPNPAADKILAILEKSPEPNPQQAEEIIGYAKQVMKQDPFSPKNINFMTYAYFMMGDGTNEAISNDRFKKIVATIKSSGTGIKESSPWHVLSFGHSSDIIADMGLQPMKRMVVSRTVEYIPLLQRHGNVKGYYFNFERVYWRKPDALPEKRSAGFEINGIQTKKKK